MVAQHVEQSPKITVERAAGHLMELMTTFDPAHLVSTPEETVDRAREYFGILTDPSLQFTTEQQNRRSFLHGAMGINGFRPPLVAQSFAKTPDYVNLEVKVTAKSEDVEARLLLMFAAGLQLAQRANARYIELSNAALTMPAERNGSGEEVSPED